MDRAVGPGPPAGGSARAPRSEQLECPTTRSTLTYPGTTEKALHRPPRRARDSVGRASNSDRARTSSSRTQAARSSAPADATQSRSNPRRSAAPRPVSVRHLARRSAQESLRSFTNRITAEPTVAFSPSNSYVLASSARRSWSSVGDPIGPFGVGYTRQDRPPTGSTSVANGSTPFTRTVGEPRRPTQSASSGVSTRRCVAVMSVNSSASESR